MDIFLIWLSLEIGKVLCYPITCYDAIRYEVTSEAEAKSEPTDEKKDSIEEKDSNENER